jgi:hypothetical protein
MRELKLGKLKSKKEVTFKLKNFIDKSALPTTIPRHFGHESFIGAMDWGMLANDQVGNCVPAGAAHETMLWNAAAGKTVIFDDKSVLSDYSAISGYDPNDPNSDQGCDMQQAASYRRKTGIVDVDGNRHTIGAYLAITPGDLHEHYIALYLFEAIGIGLDLPYSAIDQTNKNKSWTYVRRSSSAGGHYVPLVAKRTRLENVTWGQLQGMSTGFFGHYNDESLCYLSSEMLTNRKSPEGFDYDGLVKCLAALK